MVIHQTGYTLYNSWHIELHIMFQELKSVKQANILKGDDDKEGFNPGYPSTTGATYEKICHRSTLKF